MKKLIVIIMSVAMLMSVIAVSGISSSASYQAPAAPTNQWNLSARDYVAQIKAGWNYGNGLEDVNSAGYYDVNVYPNSKPSSWYNCRFDGYPTDCNGNTVTDPKIWERDMSYSAQWPLTKAMLTEINNAGFDALRLPVSWFNWSDYDSGSFTLGNGVTCSGDKISPEIFTRVKEIIDWACELDMYVILNMHHDDSIWLHVDTVNAENWSFTKTRYENYWKQIAYNFKDYGSNVMFAGMNEIVYGEFAADWYNKITTEANVYGHMGELYQTFVNIVRNSGGNNTKRYLCISPIGAQYTHCGGMQLPTDSLSDGGVNRIIIEVHEYNAFYGDNAGSTWDGILSQFESNKSRGYGYIIGEGAFSDNSSNTDDLARSQVSYETYLALRAHGIPLFQWDNGGIGNSKSSRYRTTNGTVYVGAGSVWSVFNRAECKFRFPNQIASIMNAVYGYDSTKTATKAADNYYYWYNGYKAISLNKGLFDSKQWKKGAYNADGSVNTTAKALYIDKVPVTAGSKYELRCNSFWGVSNNYLFDAYGIKANGQTVRIGSGTRTKGLAYSLLNKKHNAEGETVSMSSPFGKDVAFIVPDGVTSLAISLVGAYDWIKLSHIVTAIDSTAIVPSLGVYSGTVTTGSTKPTASSSSSTVTQVTTIPTSPSTGATVPSSAVGTTKYLHIRSGATDTRALSLSFPSATIPANAAYLQMRVKSSGAITIPNGISIRTSNDGQGLENQINKSISYTTEWQTVNLSLSDVDKTAYHSFAIRLLTNSYDYYYDDIQFVDNSGNVISVAYDFEKYQTGSTFTDYAGEWLGIKLIESETAPITTTVQSVTTNTQSKTTEPTTVLPTSPTVTNTQSKTTEPTTTLPTSPTVTNTQSKTTEPTIALPTSPTATDASVKYGDVNDDGSINAKDVLLIRKHIARWKVELNLAAADCCADNKINAKDVLLLRKFIAKLEVVLGK